MKRRDCSSEEDLKVIFDREGESFDCSDTASFSYYNSFKDSIATFYDNIAKGDWTLKIGDHGPSDVELNNWSLELCFEEIELSNASINSIDLEGVSESIIITKLHFRYILKFNNGFNVDLHDVNGRIVS